jgi:hypothetical protein
MEGLADFMAPFEFIRVSALDRPAHIQLRRRRRLFLVGPHRLARV